MHKLKGITQQLKELSVGETLTDTVDMERSDIHKIAKRVGIKVSCKKVEGGFMVTRVK